MNVIPLQLVLEALRNSWSAETAQPYDGVYDNPAKGQCCVSSLIIQHFFGGNLMRGEVVPIVNLKYPELKIANPIVHYWNEIDGAWIDSTRAQFNMFALYTHPYVNPDPVLYWFKETEQKYLLLLERVNKYISEHRG